MAYPRLAKNLDVFFLSLLAEAFDFNRLARSTPDLPLTEPLAWTMALREDGFSFPRASLPERFFAEDAMSAFFPCLLLLKTEATILVELFLLPFTSFFEEDLLTTAEDSAIRRLSAWASKFSPPFRDTRRAPVKVELK